jgi:catechol 2,3-dioxygenase-like lactoylglutathione lyase family enzyme
MNIEHLAFNVTDPVAAAAWYVRHLGMRVVRSLDVPPHTRFLADQAGRVVLEIYRQDRLPPPDYYRQDPLAFHVAFATPAIQEARQELLRAGATAEGEITTTATGDQLAMLRDPWGVPVQLVQRSSPLMR